MKNVISATTLVRQLGDILGRVRYRGETFVVERNGVAIARLTPVHSRRRVRTVEALTRWRDAAPADPDFAADLERVGAADREPGNPWDS
jgi:antitoxin (DNA-binding transcriptional repressor) of toxin-antitoxin stability system